jgi:NAD(P)-dependent dehydrogenase (short-subunit alcohol dehydrogenase family)
LVNKQFPSADAEGIKCDVSKEADVKAAIDRAVEKWGRLDVLVSRRIT